MNGNDSVDPFDATGAVLLLHPKVVVDAISGPIFQNRSECIYIAKTVKPRSTGEILVIDYLRGVAALGVALFHVRAPLWVGWREIVSHPEQYSWLDRVAALFSLPTPFMGSFVMLFFVISGFCVHLPYAGGAKPLELKAYFWRRFFRIYPPYFAAVVLSALVLAVPNANSGILSIRDWLHVLKSFAMAQNYLVEAGNGIQLATNPALWSLPVEMELYFVYPLFLWLSRRLGWTVVLALVSGVSFGSAIAGMNGLRWVTGNFAMYWIIWCGGALLAELWSDGKMGPPPKWYGAVAIVAAISGVCSTFGLITSHLEPLCYGTFYFWIVWSFLHRHLKWSRLPRPLAEGLGWLGRVSYSYYLIHYPIFILMGIVWMTIFGSKPENYGIGLLAVALSAGFVALFHKLVECPSHRWARLVPKKNGK